MGPFTELHSDARASNIADKNQQPTLRFWDVVL